MSTATDWRATYARRSRRIMIRRPVPVMVTGWMQQLGVELERWHQDFLLNQYRITRPRPAAAMRPATPIERARLLAAAEEIYGQRREAMTGPGLRQDVVTELLARPDLGSQLAGVMGVHLREGVGCVFPHGGEAAVRTLTFTRFALSEPFPSDVFAGAVGQPLPGWVTGSTTPGPGVLTAAEVAWGGWSARLTVELPEVGP